MVLTLLVVPEKPWLVFRLKLKVLLPSRVPSLVHRVWWSARAVVVTGSGRVELRLDVQDDGVGSACCWLGFGADVVFENGENHANK